MSEQTIYDALRAGGLSPAGACAMMGNMWAESGLKSNNVQDNCPMGDRDYTYNVEQGIMTRWQFMSDRYGYGLCQWTLDSRKDRLYLFAKEKAVPISDEQMQCEFCLVELREDFDGLYQYLCATEDLPKAAERICAEFERPFVNNFSDRINAAQRYYNQLVGNTGGCSDDACQIDIPTEQTAAVTMRILRRGDLGRDVLLLQSGLKDMQLYGAKLDGDFGPATEAAVKKLQQSKGIEQTGVADQKTLEIIYSRK